MSFRLRVLALVSLVAVIAVGATAYLAYRQASLQVTESAAADEQTTAAIVDELTEYGQLHGTWQGVPKIVGALKARTGQRIKLVTGSGVVVVDTDTLEGRTARAARTAPALVDPRPNFTVSTNYDGKQQAVREPAPTAPPSLRDPKLVAVAKIATVDSIERYRTGVRRAACLTRNNLRVTMSPGENGIPNYAADGESMVRWPDEVKQCEAVARNAPIEQDADVAQVDLCVSGASGDLVVQCLARAFADRTAAVAPEPLQVYLGAVGDRRKALEPWPVAAAAALVALLAVVGTALISRRVLRPIGTLTAAAEHVGQGDLSLRVPVTGRDELAQLARSFNRMADSLQRGEERQRRLVADVAHELRTPLANVRGYLEALKDGVIPPSADIFTSLHEEAVLQQRIVDDLQDLALAEAGALAYHKTRTDLAELLEICRAAQQAVADAAGVALRVVASGPVLVQADPDRLRQVIGNLVSNALRATPAGGSVTLTALEPVSGWAIVTVRDTGTGIAPDDLRHVFDRFWRADAARRRSTGGSGLGLAIARQIVTDHGGRITARSVIGEGTAVEITLPVA